MTWGPSQPWWFYIFCRNGVTTTDISPANFGPMGGHTVELPPNVLLDCPKARCKTAGRMGEHPSTEGKLVFSWLPIGEPRHRFIYMYIYIYIHRFIKCIYIHTYIYIYTPFRTGESYVCPQGEFFFSIGGKKKMVGFTQTIQDLSCLYNANIYIYIHLVI